jgi:hypothetical protein
LIDRERVVKVSKNEHLSGWNNNSKNILNGQSFTDRKASKKGNKRLNKEPMNNRNYNLREERRESVTKQINAVSVKNLEIPALFKDAKPTVH